MFKTLMSCALLFIATSAFADENNVTTSESVYVFPDSFSLNIGGLYANSDSYMVVTNPRTGGTFPLDFEDDLNLKEKQFLPFIELAYSFNQRHNIYIDLKSLHRTAVSPQIAKDFQFTLPDSDITYDVEAGISLKSTLDIDILRLGYGYDIWQGENYTIGASVGVHTMFVKTAFEGEIGICVPNTQLEQYCGEKITSPRVVDKSLTAPLPNFGVYGHYEFISGWVFKAYAQYFSLEYNDAEGSLVDVRAVVEAELNENWSLIAGFNYYEVDIDYEQTLTALDQEFYIANYNVNYSFTGPMISVQYTF
ncbi:hypothetical protein [Shewanella sp. OMA3-2]|uniref:hypothetical protein n=1 Tax=Shewanella sp. OMA3-2 TaxID=2908650 RepID=UPI001F34A641|nr:hypothetical protein [Shewanella sp. OMA3-2]UJF21062.1 hypothetical protein L0B17_12955 [Shewanella sp. OMA3-2]